jgi:hypothetical protein
VIAANRCVRENGDMQVPHDPPIQSLGPPGEEGSATDFGAELQRRTNAHRRGELESFSLDEVREIVANRLKQAMQRT